MAGTSGFIIVTFTFFILAGLMSDSDCTIEVSTHMLCSVKVSTLILCTVMVSTLYFVLWKSV